MKQSSNSRSNESGRGAGRTRDGATGAGEITIAPPSSRRAFPGFRRGLAAAAGLAVALQSASAWSFCGFFVAKADARLFNKASRVVLVRSEDRTVLTMASDYEGDPKEFALVVPVPTFLEREQIHVGDAALVEHLDAYTAPRLVEYWDPNPCEMALAEDRAMKRSVSELGAMAAAPAAHGVTVEARYTVGEYDIVILSAKESDGLESWLRDNGYKIPSRASRVLGSYLKQGMRFFVARVNLGEKQRLGVSFLRPLQIAYESPKFMLPIRLGMVNADGAQELFVYALTRKGRVETTNYRTVKLPTGMDIPEYVKDDFGDFYRSLFGEQARKENLSAVFLEYAWDMSWCDPCASNPLSRDELRQLGVFWLDDSGTAGNGISPRGGPQEVFVSRLHARYDAAHFPEDLVFQETADRENFQGRYVLRHAWRGGGECERLRTYGRELHTRHEEEAHTLASLTGWALPSIRSKMHLDEEARNDGAPRWWQKIWHD